MDLKISILKAPIKKHHAGGGFLFCGSRKLTYFHEGKQKYSVNGFKRISDTKSVMESEISYFKGSENGNCQYDSHGCRKS